MSKQVTKIGIIPEQVYNCGERTRLTEHDGDLYDLQVDGFIELPALAHRDSQRGPHNRCRHPVAPPKGFVQCKGDPGCAVLVPWRSRTRLCFWHVEDAAIQTHMTRYADLMGAEL